MTVTNVTNTSQGYQVPKTEVNVAYEIADFLFGVRSIEKIAKGEGNWGDLVNVGVTAATFLIPPAKLAQLSTKTLNTVIKASKKTIATDGVSVAAKRAAQKTLDDALATTGSKVKDPDLAVKPEVGKGTYTRKMDEDVVVEEPNPYQEVSFRDRETHRYTKTPDELYATGKEQQWSLREERTRRDLEKVQNYDKTKWTQEEIDDRIKNLSVDELEEIKQLGLKTRKEIEDYVRGGQYTDEEIEQGIKELMAWNKKRGIETDEFVKDTVGAYKGYKNAGEPVPDYIQKDINKILEMRKGQRIADKVEQEIPTELPKEPKIRYEEDIETGKSKAVVDEWEDDWLKDSIPADAYENLTVTQKSNITRSAELKYQITKLRNFSKKTKKDIEKYGNTKSEDFNSAKLSKAEKKLAKEEERLSLYTKQFNQIRLDKEEQEIAKLIYNKLKEESFGKSKTKLGETTQDFGTGRRIQETRRRVPEMEGN